MKLISKKNHVAFFWLMTLSMIFWSSSNTVIKADDTKSQAAITNEGEWKSIAFGQSASHNQIEVDNANHTVTVMAGSKDGSSTGGKIAGSHDGICYYYTEIPSSKNFELSAKITVNYFAKPVPDNQEGFGMMARDAIGKDSDTSVFASNMVLVGGYRGALQSVFRNHVKDISGSGAKMEDVFKFGGRPVNDGSATYRFMLKKTNTGYHVAVNNGPEKIYYRPKQLEVLVPDRIYVGFFAARVASITVSDIELKTSDVATDPPGIPEPVNEVKPVVNIISPAASSNSSYSLNVSVNGKGRLEIKQAGEVLYNGTIDHKIPLMKDTTLVTGKNTFDLKFTPDTAENAAVAPVSLQYVVTFKTYGEAGGLIYVSPTGQPTASGNEKDPIDIYSALQFLRPGQTICARGGIYHLTAPLLIEKGNNGVAGKLKVFSAYPKERPVFDFCKKAPGFIVGGDYWKVYGIDITGSIDNGIRISGNNNVIELVNTYANNDTGLQISGSSATEIDQWPSCNLILNCTSHDNRDAADNNADGFAAKLACGVGNILRGCISYHNCDDGYDLYSKLENGPIGAISIENSIAYGNGTLSDGTKTKGDGNGFKLGGEGLAVKHTLRHCLSFKNNGNGVTSNSDPAIMVLNTTSADNGKANFSFNYYSNATPQFIAQNNISFRTLKGGKDSFPAGLKTDSNYFYDGDATLNASGKKVAASDFMSVTPVFFQRKADGAIESNDYMALTKTTSVTGGCKIN